MAQHCVTLWNIVWKFLWVCAGPTSPEGFCWLHVLIIFRGRESIFSFLQSHKLTPVFPLVLGVYLRILMTAGGCSSWRVKLVISFFTLTDNRFKVNIFTLCIFCFSPLPFCYESICYWFDNSNKFKAAEKMAAMTAFMWEWNRNTFPAYYRKSVSIFNSLTALVKTVKH